MVIKTWIPRPIQTVIIEILLRKGPMTNKDLYKIIKETYPDLGYNILNREIMHLEIRGSIHVSGLIKGNRRIELLKSK